MRRVLVVIAVSVATVARGQDIEIISYSNAPVTVEVMTDVNGGVSNAVVATLHSVVIARDGQFVCVLRSIEPLDQHGPWRPLYGVYLDPATWVETPGQPLDPVRVGAMYNELAYRIWRLESTFRSHAARFRNVKTSH